MPNEISAKERIPDKSRHELPPLAKDILEKKHLFSVEIPDELPSIDAIVKKKVPEKKSSSDNSEVSKINERLSCLEGLAEKAGFGKQLKLRDGRILSSIQELREALPSMAQETFNLHVNFERNDFAEWVRSTFSDDELAARIDSATSKAQLIRILNDFFD